MLERTRPNPRNAPATTADTSLAARPPKISTGTVMAADGCGWPAGRGEDWGDGWEQPPPLAGSADFFAALSRTMSRLAQSRPTVSLRSCFTPTGALLRTNTNSAGSRAPHTLSTSWRAAARVVSGAMGMDATAEAAPSIVTGTSTVPVAPAAAAAAGCFDDVGGGTFGRTTIIPPLPPANAGGESAGGESER